MGEGENKGQGQGQGHIENTSKGDEGKGEYVYDGVEGKDDGGGESAPGESTVTPLLVGVLVAAAPRNRRAYLPRR